MILFPMPGPEQRARLWAQSFPEKMSLEERVSLKDIASKYEMSGGAIMNVARYAALAALKRENPVILLKDMQLAIRKEFGKEGKSV
jgi:ATP-dependent 26S proteasome regulatory subunit